MSIKSTVKKILNRMNYSKILMYHHVSDPPELQCSGCLISTKRFMQSVSDYSNYTDIYSAIRKNKKGYTAITFDDGLHDEYTVAYPFLKEQNIPFTVFIVFDFIGKPGYITKEELIELANDPLVTIGGHGLTHNVLKGMPFAKQQEEIISSTKQLEQIIEKKIDIFAYSHGQFDKNTVKIMKQFRYGFTAGGGNLNFIKKINRYALPRIGVE